jgi:hypothetical protein
MEGREKPSLGVRIFAPLFFISGSLSALLWFFFRVFDVFFGALSKIEVFDKGSFYMLGVGVGLLILSIVTVQEGWLGKPLSKRQSTYLTKAAFVGVALIFTVPHLAHYSANKYLFQKGYAICAEAEHQWLFVRNIVYIQPSVACSANLKRK